MLVEAVGNTEQINRRWLLARKREQNEKNITIGAPKAATNFKERYNSRRGSLNTITFPEVDYMPEILKLQVSERIESKRSERALRKTRILAMDLAKWL